MAKVAAKSESTKDIRRFEALAGRTKVLRSCDLIRNQIVGIF